MPQNIFRTEAIWLLGVGIRSDVPHSTNEPDLILGLNLFFIYFFFVVDSLDCKNKNLKQREKESIGQYLVLAFKMEQGT